VHDLAAEECLFEERLFAVLTNGIKGHRPRSRRDPLKLGAIIVVGQRREWPEINSKPALVRNEQSAMLPGPLCFVEVCGRSVMDRMSDRFIEAGVETVSVLIDAELSYPRKRFRKDVTVKVVDDLGLAVRETLCEYAQNGVDHSFINWADTFLETDLLDFFYFHKEARRTFTRAFDREGVLDLWVVDCTKSQSSELAVAMETTDSSSGASYFVRECAKRVKHARDLREIALDMLQGRCEGSPAGEQVRPGVWIEAGAEVHRGARIVAPAYIGRNTKILEDTLITRSSNIEADCVIDCGTVVEDSSILANTRVGIWLDVCHSVVSENKMLSLERDVMAEIPDQALLRANHAHRGARARQPKRKAYRAGLVEQNLAPQWHFGADLIQD